MMISTRGRYALRVMVDLAEMATTGYVPMRAVAERQGLSLKYLEQILPVLVKNGYVTGMHGKKGGYRLAKDPAEYRVGDILRLTEGELTPVGCTECGKGSCERAESCRTLPMWNEFHRMVNDYFDGITLADLMQ
ncbi:MAG: RrF2 family transcriptional regulator [Clostridia bacterium]|nr:RrF2 family transcriptional regulator [Clostridia bacterium]